MKYLPCINPSDNIKNLKLIIHPKIKDSFYEDVLKLKTDYPIFDFLKTVEKINIDYSTVDDIDKINLNRFDRFDNQERHIWNFYDYSPKLKENDLKLLEILATKRNLNKHYLYSNGDVYYKNNNIAVRKTMKNHGESLVYYNYIKKILKYKLISNRFIEYNISDRITLDVLKNGFFKELSEKIIYFWDRYSIWTNNINYETIGYSSKIDFFDPDMFYWKKTTKEISTIKDTKEFIKNYKYYKLRPKNVIYYLNDYNKEYLHENLIYLYFSYIILENMSIEFK